MMDCHCRPLAIGSGSGSSGSLFAALVSVIAISGQVRFLTTVTVETERNCVGSIFDRYRLGARGATDAGAVRDRGGLLLQHVLRSPDDYEPLAPEWSPTEPQLVNGGAGRLVIHTGGRGLVRVTVSATETPAPPLADSPLTVWEDIAEGSFTIESNALCFDGFSGEMSLPIPHPGPGPCRVRVVARGRQSIGTPTGRRRLNRRCGSTSNCGRSNSATGASSSTEPVHRQPYPNRRHHRGTAAHRVAEKRPSPRATNHHTPAVQSCSGAVTRSGSSVPSPLPKSEYATRKTSSRQRQDRRRERRSVVRHRVRSPTDAPEPNPVPPTRNR